MPRKPIGTLPLNVLLPKRLKEELLALAAADRRKLSGYMQIALIAHVARARHLKPKTLGLAGRYQACGGQYR